MRRQSWEEVRDYWERHAQRDGAVDLGADPDALGNVIWPGQPVWLNAHLGALQEAAYDRLLERLPQPRPGDRALDVGCGSARWSRRLAAFGFAVVGIDLQEELIQRNRRRFPELEFERSSVQDFRVEQPFALISSVTVIQHNPFEEQSRIVARLRALVRNGGHALVLENIRDQSDYVFARSIGEWQRLFEGAGFRLLRALPYDYSPCLRAVLACRNLLLGATGAGSSAAQPDAGGRAREWMRQALAVAMRAAITIDRPLERRLSARPTRHLGAVHCGFLFEAA
jgi:2-polyprenyl-3-methyl-5-hydroxy-6-metoxy-1,4-benzoquinol methylase